MKMDLPGLLKERLPSGSTRYRVRVEGNPAKRVRLHVAPKHPNFMECYRAARAGIEIKPDESNALQGSLGWLGEKYIEHIENQVRNNLLSPKTLAKKRHFQKTLASHCGEYAVNIPSNEIAKIRDTLAATPAAADGFVGFMKTMFSWGIGERLCSINPALAVGKIDRGKGGSTPWTVEDLKTFREFHKSGTTAHLCLTMLMFTACRIGDAAIMGRGDEITVDGNKWLSWQPQKRGSALVEVPMVRPLIEATRSPTVQGSTYLLNEYGRPFASSGSLSARFKKWCQQAGLPDRSAHGVRKAAGHLLAQEGCSQYQIMAIHGHTQAQTSEIYTKGVERRKMASDAIAALAKLEW